MMIIRTLNKSNNATTIQKMTARSSAKIHNSTLITISHTTTTTNNNNNNNNEHDNEHNNSNENIYRN